MSSPVSILISESNYLVRRGLEALLEEQDQFSLLASVSDQESLYEALLIHQPDVIITDYNGFPDGTDLLRKITKKSPSAGILVITNPRTKLEISLALESGACGFLLSECELDEIVQAICLTAQHSKFICGKIVELMTNDSQDQLNAMQVSCAGMNVSMREVEIIRHVAEGFSNKEIADKLFLSTHTVTTHRKNIMNKLQVNNTAGLVLFAVKNNLLGPNKFLFS